MEENANYSVAATVLHRVCYSSSYNPKVTPAVFKDDKTKQE